jgi:hypothetical protein
MQYAPRPLPLPLLIGPRLLMVLSPLSPRVVLSLDITMAGIMMLPTATLMMDFRDMLRAIGTLQAVYILLCGSGDMSTGMGVSNLTSILRSRRMEDELLDHQF